MTLQDIESVTKATGEHRGYFINTKDGKRIHLTKRRTIIALLVLIHKGEGSEADLAQGNSTIREIREILGDRLPAKFVVDYYGDANKPYSELWNEEGFTFIDNLKGGRAGLSQLYTLKTKDHAKLFSVAKKAFRKAPSKVDQIQLLNAQNNRCNLCGSKIRARSEISRRTYAKDRRRLVFDHRKPVEKGGDSDIENFQALCFYCNKCKWQICNICELPNCDPNCALRNPENSNIVSPTSEDINDVLANRGLFDQE